MNKNGSLSDLVWNQELIVIAKTCLDATVVVQAATMSFDAKPHQKIKIEDSLDITRSGVYEVLESKDPKIVEVRRLDTEYPYRAGYYVASLGRSWNYRKVEKKRTVVEWEKLKTLRGKTVNIFLTENNKSFPVRIVNFTEGKNDTEEKMIVIKEGETKKKFFGFLSKGKGWEAIVETEQ